MFGNVVYVGKSTLAKTLSKTVSLRREAVVLRESQ